MNTQGKKDETLSVLFSSDAQKNPLGRGHPDASNKDVFHNDFTPREYCEEYYNEIDKRYIWNYFRNTKDFEKIPLKTVEEENSSLLVFLGGIVRPLLVSSGRKDLTVLEIGGGLTIYQLISIAPFASQIHFTDYLESNLVEVGRWRAGNESHINRWNMFIEGGLMVELKTSVITKQMVSARKELIRNKITSLYAFDVINNKGSLFGRKHIQYDIVNTHFCIDSITDNLQVWYDSLGHVVSKIKSGGRLIMTSLAEAKTYSIGEKRFPSCDLTEDVVRTALYAHGLNNVRVFRSRKSDGVDSHYDGFIFVTAVKE